jgi:hypothetical protein
MRSILALFIVIAVVFITPARAGDSELASLFSDAGIDGTILIARLDGSERYVHNEQRAARRLPAASTFKIFNTLIALDEGAVSGLDEVIRWDGHLYDFPDWNQDHTIKSAYAASCVWCYQELASRIGGDRYRANLARAGYGRLQEPFDETTFWLDGSLTISAEEQVEFLHQVILQALLRFLVEAGAEMGVASTTVPRCNKSPRSVSIPRMAPKIPAESPISSSRRRNFSSVVASGTDSLPRSMPRKALKAPLS